MNQLEHANITVPDIDAAIRFIQLMAADMQVRRDAVSERGYRWVHIGNQHSYIALQAEHPGSQAKTANDPYVNYGVNHLCFRVDDVAAVEQRLLAAGYRQNGPMVLESYRKRIYFYDDMGMEWEMVEYFSDDLQQMHLFE